MAIIPKSISDKVLIVGEAFKNRASGGIAAVLRYYEPYFESFNFVASHKGDSMGDKLKYDLGGLFKMVFNLHGKRIVHIHTAAGGSFRNHQWYVRMAHLFGKKVILHCHASSFESYFHGASQRKKKNILRTLNRVECLIVLSKFWEEFFRGIGVNSQIVILNNITDHPKELPKVPQDGPRHFLFMGEIGQRKGIFDLLDTLGEHKEALLGKIKLKIGGNKNEAELKSKIKNLGLESMVDFEGFVSGDKKANLLNWAEVFILPSYNEGLPIAILEAMSYGCAIISTPVGGIPEVVDETNGILVDPGNHDQIFNAISTMISQNLDPFSESSKSKVQAFYPESVLEHLLKIYTYLC